MGYAAGGAAAASAAAIANAIKATGAIVKLNSDNFQKILLKADSPLVVRTEYGFFSRKYQYITSYKGLAFYTKSPYELSFREGTEIVLANKISVPE